MNIGIVIIFAKFIKSCLSGTNIDTCRNKYITFKDIFYFCSHKNGNSFSYSLANYHMKMKNITNVTDKAYLIKRNSIDPIYFEKINDYLLEHLYKNNGTPRILGIDGTYLPVSINLKKMDIELQLMKLIVLF